MKRKAWEKTEDLKELRNDGQLSVFIKKTLIEYIFNSLNCPSAQIDFDYATMLLIRVTGENFYERVLESEMKSWYFRRKPLTDGETKRSDIGLLFGSEGALLFLKERFGKYLLWRQKRLPRHDGINDRLAELARVFSLDNVQRSMLKFALFQAVCPATGFFLKNPTEEVIFQLTGCKDAKAILEEPCWSFLADSIHKRACFDNWKASLKWRRLKPSEQFAAIFERNWEDIPKGA